MRMNNWGLLNWPLMIIYNSKCSILIIKNTWRSRSKQLNSCKMRNRINTYRNNYRKLVKYEVICMQLPYSVHSDAGWRQKHFLTLYMKPWQINYKYLHIFFECFCTWSSIVLIFWWILRTLHSNSHKILYMHNNWWMKKKISKLLYRFYEV